MIFQKGDTVRFTAQFKNFEDVPCDVMDAKCVVYDDKWNVIEENTLTIDNKLKDNADKVIVGGYFYEFTLDRFGDVYFEFSGQLNGSRALRRGKVKVTFD